MPLVYLSTGWLMGIWAASMLALPAEVLLVAALIPLIGLVLWWRERRVRLIWLAALFAVFGGLRYQLSLPHFDQNSLVTYNDAGEVTIEGMIDAEPDTRDTYINLRVNAERVILPDKTTHPIEGLFLTRPSRPADFKYRDRIRVTGDLTTPPEFATFSYKDYLARQGVYSLIDRPRVGTLAHDQGSPILAAIFAFKARANEVITHILPEPQASLLTGILLGNEAGLSADVQDKFRRTGTTHIIAISG